MPVGALPKGHRLRASVVSISKKVDRPIKLQFDQ